MDIIENIRENLEEELKEIFKKQDRLVLDLYNLDTKDNFNSYRITKDLKVIDGYSKLVRDSINNTYLVKDFTDDRLVKDIKGILNFYYESIKALSEDKIDSLLTYNGIFLKEYKNYSKDRLINRKLLENVYIILNYNILPVYNMDFVGDNRLVKKSNSLYRMFDYLSFLKTLDEEEYDLKAEALIEEFIDFIKTYIGNGFMINRKMVLDGLVLKKYILMKIFFETEILNESPLLNDKTYSDIFLKLIKDLVIELDNGLLYGDLNSLYNMYIKILFEEISITDSKKSFEHLTSIETIYFLEALDIIDSDEYPIYTYEELKTSIGDNLFVANRIRELEIEYNKILDEKRVFSLNKVEDKEENILIHSDELLNLNIKIARVKKEMRKLYLQVNGLVWLFDNEKT